MQDICCLLSVTELAVFFIQLMYITHIVGQ